jgi:pseudouridine kinase
MTDQPDILCIGACLWDVIGRTAQPMEPGADVPGRIARGPGGVALNAALTLARLGLRPALLTAIGRDAAGDELVAACTAHGLLMHLAHRPDDLPTDIYMAIEAANGLVAAIADAHSLEAAGARILAPLADGRLGNAERPWQGTIVLDGNLTQALLADIAADPYLAEADLRLAPASPGKAERLRPLLAHPRATLYVNLAEASLLAGRTLADAPQAAAALRAQGASRVLVTDGGRTCALAGPFGTVTATPPIVAVARVTGAGDTLLAAHIVAERRGAAPEAALAAALTAAADHVSGKDPS